MARSKAVILLHHPRQMMAAADWRVHLDFFSGCIYEPPLTAATKVKINMVPSGNLLTLEISDNEKGFDPQQRAGGTGLDNIIQRANSYNGKVKIETSPGNGCKLNAVFLLSEVKSVS